MINLPQKTINIVMSMNTSNLVGKIGIPKMVASNEYSTPSGGREAEKVKK
ncbi:hypothetical protein Hanom_Chr17g01532591 [Helianthus anomalus]